MKDLEGNVSSADMERTTHDKFKFKQGRKEGLKAGSDCSPGNIYIYIIM